MTVHRGMYGNIKQKCLYLLHIVIYVFFIFLPHQSLADDEVSTRLLHNDMSLMLSTTSHVYVLCLRSSITFYIRVFVCPLLLIVPSTCQYVLHPSHVSKPHEYSFPDLVYKCIFLSQLLLRPLVSYSVPSGSSRYSTQPAHLRHQQSSLRFLLLVLPDIQNSVTCFSFSPSSFTSPISNVIFIWSLSLSFLH